MKDYGLNKLTIGANPVISIITKGSFTGSPCLYINTGIDIQHTNRSLTDKLNGFITLGGRVLFSGEDPTIFSNELWSFIKYYNNVGANPRIWHIITDGHRYDVKFLYELDHILIDVKCPSSGIETPPEFISWCAEDPNLVNKIEFMFVVDAHSKDITFALDQIRKIGTWKRPITVHPGRGWKDYREFVQKFQETVRYPYFRILPDLSYLYRLNEQLL